MDVRLAAEKFTDGVDALTAGRWDGTNYIHGRYTRLRESLTGATASYGHGSQRRPPCSTAALDLLCRIDHETQQWLPEIPATIDRLSKLAHATWAPQHVGELLNRTHRLQGWVAEAALLLGDNAVTVPLRRNCPRCRSLWAYDSDGTRRYALIASESEARCQHCRASWPAEHFPMLARLLEDPCLT